MPRTLTATVIAPLLAMLPLLAMPGAVLGAEASRALAPFIAVNAKGAFALSIEAGAAQSVRISGSDAFIQALKTEVVDNELQISVSGKLATSDKGDQHITITLPSLSRVKVEGAGETIITKVASERLDLGYRGAGRLSASGKVKYLRLSAMGVGEVDTKGLKSERVDVNFNGVGEVSVYASDTVNIVAKGMGSVTYYGKPKTVNKSVAGIGSVSAGD